MPDVRGLVGIDVGVLDDDLFAGGSGLGICEFEERFGVSGAFKAEIQVAVAGNFHRGNSRDGSDLRGQLRGDLARSLLQQFGQLECRRHRQFAEFRLLGLLDGNRQIDAVPGLNM